MNIIRIQSDELQQIIFDRLLEFLPAFENDANECVELIMEDISKSNPFKVWRR